MTEDEAKTKWCPMTRVSDMPGINRFQWKGGHNAEEFKCVASDCMMWRVSPKQYLVNGKFYDTDLTGTGKWVDMSYCGLAGKP